ncbi:cell division cycle-associated protein 2 [Latimeria chalumnae]|uniref:cell division cycle-associated protein 2 n=1 Tax=Latimeria chalumnae TaxID=7897 RepID=UPI00313F19D2
MNSVKSPVMQTSLNRSQNNSALKEKMAMFHQSFQAVEEDERKTLFPDLSKPLGSQTVTDCEKVCDAVGQCEDPVRSSELSCKRKKTTFAGHPSLTSCDGYIPAKSPLYRELPPLFQMSPCASPLFSRKEPVVAQMNAETAGENFDEIGNQNDDPRELQQRKDFIVSFPGLSPDDKNQETEKAFNFSEEKKKKEKMRTNNKPNQRNKKRVTFTEELIPEIFDEKMPPNSPLCKGGSPVHPRLPTSVTTRPVLKKTPAKMTADPSEERLADSSSTLKSSQPITHERGAIPFPQLDEMDYNQTDRNSPLIETTEMYKEEQKLSKRKKVTFGGELIPELFDETLPPNTPVRKGETPEQQGVTSSTTPRPVLKRTSAKLTTFVQPNFDILDEHNGSKEEVSQITDSLHLVASPGNNLSKLETGKKNPASNRQVHLTRSSTKRKLERSATEGSCSVSFVLEVNSTSEQKLTTSGKKDVKTVKKTNEGPASKKPRVVKGKGRRGKKGKKSVLKSIYGQREFASKKPLLSPIPEMLENLSITCTPVVTPTEYKPLKRMPFLCVPGNKADSQNEFGGMSEEKSSPAESKVSRKTKSLVRMNNRMQDSGKKEKPIASEKDQEQVDEEKIQKKAGRRASFRKTEECQSSELALSEVGQCSAEQLSVLTKYEVTAENSAEEKDTKFLRKGRRSVVLKLPLLALVQDSSLEPTTALALNEPSDLTAGETVEQPLCHQSIDMVHTSHGAESCMDAIDFSLEDALQAVSMPEDRRVRRSMRLRRDSGIIGLDWVQLSSVSKENLEDTVSVSGPSRGTSKRKKSACRSTFEEEENCSRKQRRKSFYIRSEETSDSETNGDQP